VQIAGAIPFAPSPRHRLLGGPKLAPAIINLISLPAAFGSGMWIPINDAGRGEEDRPVSSPPITCPARPEDRSAMDDHRGVGGQGATVLAVFTLLSLGLPGSVARDEGRTFG